MRTFLILLLASFTLIACKKDEIDGVETDPITNQGLLGELEGDYSGYIYYTKEEIDCPNCQPPCDFIYVYDTIYTTVQVQKIGQDSIQLTDAVNGYATRKTPMDSTLKYSGYPPNNAPEGGYELNFHGSLNDSLTISIIEGGGSNCGGLYYTYKYKLSKD